MAMTGTRRTITSATSHEPWKETGTGMTWSFGPHTMRISSSSTMVAPEGDQDLEEVLAVDRPDDHALEDDAERDGDEHGAGHRERGAASAFARTEGELGPAPGAGSEQDATLKPA